MVEPLHDGHITISKGEKILYKFKKPSNFKLEFGGLEKEFWETAYRNLENNGFTTIQGLGPLFKDEHLYYVSRNKEIAYIRITRCFGEPESLFDDKKELKDTKLMLRIFDSLLLNFSDTRTLILDLRSNGGGHAGIELAGRFVKDPVLTHYKALRKPGNYTCFTNLQPIYLHPDPGAHYSNPVILLTNDKTASSAEDLTISLYQQARVTTIGENTSGMLSDMFSAELPNGLSFTLSDQCYYSLEKEILEDKGIPVKIHVKNTAADLKKGLDAVILKSLEVSRE